MSTESIPIASSRGLKRVACLTPLGVPAGFTDVTAKTIPAPTGTYRVIDSFDALSSGAAGVQRRVKVVPISTGNQTYNLVVYGSMFVANQWMWVPLFKGSVVASLQFSGTDDAPNGITTNDYLPVTVTQASGGPSTEWNDVTNYGAGVGPAHVMIDTRGCPHLLFKSDTTNTAVLVGGHS